MAVGPLIVEGHRPSECPCVGMGQSPLMAGKRPPTGQQLSDFGLFGHLERVIYLDTEVSQCALELRMT